MFLIGQLHFKQWPLLYLLFIGGSWAWCEAPYLWCIVGVVGLLLLVGSPSVGDGLPYSLLWPSQHEVLCESFPVLQVSLLETVLFLIPLFFQAIFSHSSSLCCSRSDFCACIKSCMACAVSSWAHWRWASLDQWFCVDEWAHRMFLMFCLSRAL